MAGRGIVTLLCYSFLSVTFFHCCSFHCSWLALYTFIMSAPGSRREVKDPGWKRPEEFDWLRERGTGAPDGKKGSAILTRFGGR